MKNSITIILILMLSSSLFGSMSFDCLEGCVVETVVVRHIHEGETFSFEFIRDDPNDVTPIKAWNLPNGSSFVDDVFSWTPDYYQSGMYNISFSFGEEYEYLRIMVFDTHFSIKHSELYEILFTATDPENDPVKITVPNLPEGATLTGSEYGPKLFSWTPTKDQMGVHHIILEATDDPNQGEPLTDISDIYITVSRLTADQRQFDFDGNDMIDLVDYNTFGKNWLAGVLQADPNFVLLPIVNPTVPTTVFFTDSGSKYHKKDCSYLTNSTNIKFADIKEMKALGKTACSRCKPDEAAYSSYPKMTEEEMIEKMIDSLRDDDNKVLKMESNMSIFGSATIPHEHPETIEDCASCVKEWLDVCEYIE